MDLISRRSALCGFASALALGVVGAESAPVSPVVLKRGVNAFPWFALTREYPAPSRAYAWPPFQPQRPVPTLHDLHVLAAAGFDFVRIPVDPGPFLAAAPDQRQSLLADLDAAVRASLAAGLAVVVNLQANAATHYWTPERLTGSVEAPEFAAFAELITAIAAALSRLPQWRVALEPINEPGGACDAFAYLAVRKELLARARAAAPSLTLVASGGCGSLIQGLPVFNPTPLFALKPLLFTFHFYEPYLFTHQGAQWMREPIYRSLGGVPWPGSAGSLEETLAVVQAKMAADQERTEEAKRAVYAETEKALTVYFNADPGRPFIDRYLAFVGDWAKRFGIPNEHVLMGEFGALRADARNSGASAADRARYIRDVREVAESYRFPWAFWCLFDSMGLMDDATRALDPAIVQSLGLTPPPG